MKQSISPAVAIPLVAVAALILLFGAWKLFLAPATASGAPVDAKSAQVLKENRERKGESR